MLRCGGGGGGGGGGGLKKNFSNQHLAYVRDNMLRDQEKEQR